MPSQALTADRLRELLHYDPGTGVFTRRARTAKCVQVGDVAGTDDGRGYRSIYVDGRRYYAHRLAWLCVHGCWPSGLIDHIDGDRSNNRIHNLRDADDLINVQNVRTARRHSKSKLLGASWCSITQKFKAQIRSGGRNRHLGVFDTAEEAHAAYLEAKRRLHQGCAI